MTNTKHDYLVALIRELEKENNSVHLDTFWAKVEGELKMRKHLHGYIDLPISQEQYDTLISAAEHLLGVDNKSKELHRLQYEAFVADGTTQGRTNGATSADGASDIVTDALVDYSLINMDFANHILKSYTPDQLTIDIINQAAQESTMVDGVKVNKQTAAFIEEKIKMLQSTYSFKEAAAALDIDYADIANQDLDQLKTWDEIKAVAIDDNGNQRIQKISDEAMKHFKEAYAVLASRDESYHSGAVYTQDEIEYHMGQAPDGYKMIWYFPPFEQYFVGDLTNMVNFPFIYKDSDPSHEWVVKNTPVVGPFTSVKELADYYDVVAHEHAGMDIEFMDYLVDLITMIKHYESKNDKGQYTLIIDTLWSKLKTFLLGNI